jgi:hypothetical protein
MRAISPSFSLPIILPPQRPHFLMKTLSELLPLGPPRDPPYVAPEFSPTLGVLPAGRGFRPAGEVLAARLSESPLRSIKNPGTATAAQRAGKRYEKKVLTAVSKLFPHVGPKSLLPPSPVLSEVVHALPSPWIAFTARRDRSAERHCQPDLLLIGEREILVCEIKLAHTVDAYWQLRHLYGPVVAKLFPSHTLRLVEITRSFDPVVRFGEGMRLFFSLEHVLRTPPANLIEVIQWKL